MLKIIMLHAGICTLSILQDGKINYLKNADKIIIVIEILIILMSGFSRARLAFLRARGTDRKAVRQKRTSRRLLWE